MTGGRSLVLALALALAPAAAVANGFEDVFLLGHRVKGMGGAGTASARDSSATWYNPAGLAFCPYNELSLGVTRVAYGLEVEAADGPPPEPLDDRTVGTLGVCLLLPLDFAFGLVASLGFPNMQHLDQASLDPRPIFALYGRRLESLSLMFGPAYRVRDDLAVGLALSVLADSDLLVRTEVPLATRGAEVSSSLQWRLDPSVAVYAGVAWLPAAGLRVGASYRSALSHRLVALAPTQVELGGVLVALDLKLESVTWYSPRQAAVGVSYEVSPWLTVAADVTWYGWSSYPGPFVHASPSSDSAVGRALIYPPSEPPAFSDTLVPRAGAQLGWDGWAARAGYGFRPTPASEPAGVGNLIDADVHTLSLGGGYAYRVDAGYVVEVNASLSVGVMPERRVDKGGTQPALDGYGFSGTVTDAGLTVSTGYTL